MPLTRAQYIQGDGSQGKVLPGEVQGVKQGAGTIIATDGTISFYPETAVGVVKLNSTSAYNSYVWPNVAGQSGTFLGVNGSGELAWLPPPGLVSLGSAPTNPRLGQLWFDYGTNLTYVYQDRGSIPSWYPVYRGVEPSPAFCTADPAFSGGDGSLDSPFSLDSATTRNDNTVLLSNTVTISELAPFQYVPIVDLNRIDNNYRFQVTNNFADGEGVLTFKVKFADYPQTPPGTAYSARFRIGFDEPFYVSAAIGIIFPVSIQSAGSITGSPVVGQILTYSGGLAAGGAPPYNYTWDWKLETGGTPLQTNGNTYVISPSAAGNRVYVQLTATDASLDQAVGNTGTLPSSPGIITKDVFPITDILYPTTATGSATTVWQDAGTTLRSNGCIEFSVDNVIFNQGPTIIANGGSLTTRWINSPSCSGADNGVTITGCIYNDFYQDCGSLQIDEVPSPFSFFPVTNVPPNTVASSLAITPIGFNSVAYVTYNGTSSGLSIQGSTNGGTTWTTLPLDGGTALPISPGDSLRVRMTVGSNFSADYSAIINIGVGTTVQSAIFTATTAASTIFSTLISFPTITTQEASSVAWSSSDSPTSLSATGCIQFKVNSGGTWKSPGDSPTPILTGDTLFTRWSNVLPDVCGNATHGSVITGTISNIPSGGTKTSNASLTLDRVPSTFSFTNLNNQATSSVITSNSINISGTNAPAFLTYDTSSTLTSLQASVGGGAWTTIPSSGETLSIAPVASGLGTTLQIRGTTGSGTSQTYTATVKIGQSTSINNTTWSVITAAIIPSVTTPSILTPINGAINLNPNSTSPAGINITSSPYISINGASTTHASTDWEIRKVSTSGPIVANVNSTTQLTSYFLAGILVEANTAYFVRSRYYSGGGSPVLSAWSSWSQFNTATTFTLQFVVRLIPNLSSVGGFAGATDPSPGGYTVMVGANNRSYKTLDGITFVPGGGPNVSRDATGLAYGNNKFVTVCPTTILTFSTSQDNGSTWTAGPPSSITYASVAYSPTLDLFCAVSPGGRIYTSPSSIINWTARTSPTTQSLHSVIWDGTAFRACGGTAYLSSTNGTTWTLTSIPLAPDSRGLGQIAYNSSSGRYFMTRGYDPGSSSGTGSTYGMYSTNGTTWTQTTAPGNLETVAAGGNWFVAGSSQPNNIQVYTSNDAITWTLSYTNNSYYHVHGIHYIPSVNRFMFSAHDWVLFSSV